MPKYLAHRGELRGDIIRGSLVGVVAVSFGFTIGHAPTETVVQVLPYAVGVDAFVTLILGIIAAVKRAFGL